MARLLKSQGVMLKWLQYVEAFGLKDFPKDEGHSGFDVKFQKAEDGQIESLGDFSDPCQFK